MKAEDPPERAFVSTASRVLFDQILNLENLRLGRELDANVAEDGHQLLTKRPELFARTPDFADSQIVVRPERDMHFKSGRIRPDSSRLHESHALVVLLPRGVRRMKANNDARAWMYAVMGCTTPCASIAANTSGGGEASIAFIWPGSDTSAVTAMLLLPSAAT